MSAFKIATNPDLEPVCVFSDNLNMVISTSQFENIIRTFHKGSNFFVNVQIQCCNIRAAETMVTPMVCKFSLRLFEVRSCMCFFFIIFQDARDLFHF